MNVALRSALAAAGLAFATQAAAEVVFYEHEGFSGRSFTTERQVANFERAGFNDRASSIAVFGERWEVCDDARFGGRCVVLRPGRYPSLAALGLNDRVSSARAVARNARYEDNRYAPAPVAAYERYAPATLAAHDYRRNNERPEANGTAEVVFYEHEGFSGRSFTTEKQVANFERAGYNDRASSIVVFGERWEVCEDARFGGRCVVLRPGRYPSLAALGLNDRVSSARAVARNAHYEENRYAPAPVAANERYAPATLAAYDYRRRNNERLYEANVTSVRAVVGPDEQRCWVEREQVSQGGGANMPGAIIGGIIGGVLGHQVGGGRGKDVATAGGAVAGAAIGSNVGRDSGAHAYSQDVKRCTSVPSDAGPEYWDVTYNFRGNSHRMQMRTPPGNTVTVNAQGEPRA